MKFRIIHLWGILAALLAFGLDRWGKLAALNAHETGNLPINITSFFDIVFVWNPGVSFSFLANSGDIGRYTLTLLAVVLSIIFIFWMSKSRHIVFILSMGLIIGGALGNAFDRLLYGQVVDFLFFYYQKWSFPVFNFADCAITLGGFLYIYMLIFAKDE
ncbi:MAG: signal peptidase II [Alphaproteobacteria bacterium]